MISGQVNDYPSDAEILLDIARSDLILRLSFGLLDHRGICWSVNCLQRKTNKEFESWFFARDYSGCLQVAWRECEQRSWIVPNESKADNPMAG